MKQSDSSTSLSKLVVSDTGCFICKEGDEEAGRGPLRDSKEFGTSCSCRFAFHTECIEDWMRLHPNECPVCSVRLLHHKVEEVIGGDTSIPASVNQQPRSKKARIPKWAKCILTVLAIGSILCIVFLLSNYAG